MRFDTFLQRAAQRHPALVFQVSWANGLDIIRDLSAEGVPLLALDANARALGLRSRLAAGMVCPDPRDDEEAFLTFLEDLGRRLPRKGVLFPTHDQYIWPISRHAERLEPYYLIPFSRWETMERLHDKRAQMEAAWRAGVDTPKTVFVDSAEDLERGVEEVGFPCIFKPVESLAFKTRFRRHVLEIGSADELRETYAKVRRLRHADAAGHRARRRRGALHARLVPRRAEPAAGRVHRPQAAPAPAAVRPREHGREPLGAGAGRGGAAPARRARLPRRQPGRVQARHRATAGTASWRSTRGTGCGTRSAPPAASTSRSPPTATPSASRTCRRASATVSSGSSRSPTRATPSGAGAAATRSSGRGSRATAASRWTACTRCATRSPARS